MYTPAAFAEADLPKLHDFIEGHSFGVLISQALEFTASHLPFLLDRQQGPQGRLIGHMANANPQWRQANGNPVLVVFSGPHAYISPSWYGEENVVPTWNYVAVHVYGTLRVIEDTGVLIQIIQETVERYEQSLPRPWTYRGSAEFLGRLMGMIVGFEIDIDRIEGKWKLSQNHSPQRRERLIQGLLTSADPGAHALARLMQKTPGSSDAPKA